MDYAKFISENMDMFSERMKGKLLVVPAGSLDSGSTMRPDAHIFAGSRANWDENLENIPVLEGPPA